MGGMLPDPFHPAGHCPTGSCLPCGGMGWGDVERLKLLETLKYMCIAPLSHEGTKWLHPAETKQSWCPLYTDAGQFPLCHLHVCTVEEISISVTTTFPPPPSVKPGEWSFWNTKNEESSPKMSSKHDRSFKRVVANFKCHGMIMNEKVWLQKYGKYSQS